MPTPFTEQPTLPTSSSYLLSADQSGLDLPVGLRAVHSGTSLSGTDAGSLDTACCPRLPQTCPHGASTGMPKQKLGQQRKARTNPAATGISGRQVHTLYGRLRSASVLFCKISTNPRWSCPGSGPSAQGHQLEPTPPRPFKPPPCSHLLAPLRAVMMMRSAHAHGNR
jgi:hypothetical protein